ncbi:MAG: flagellar hook-length control protein FliK [Limnohabitans sp.]
MTFQSLSSLPLGPGAPSVAKTQEHAAVRPERSNQAGLDFSAYLSQAMQSKEWAGASNLQRQGLADLGPKDLDRSAPGPQHKPANNESSGPAQRGASDNKTSHDDTRAQTPNTGGTRQELTQRALRNASLRAAQARAEANTSGRAAHGEVKSRKAAARHDDEARAATAANTAPSSVLPNAAHHPVQAAADSHAQKPLNSANSAVSVATPGDEAGHLLVPAAPVSIPDTSTLAITEAVPAQALASAGLTTVQLSPHLQVITPGQGVVNEQSLQAFAQSMGIDAQVFKQLSTPAAPGSVDISGLRAGVTATDALNGTPILPAAPTDMSAIDLSQAVPAGLMLEDLHIDWLGGRRSLELSTPSTLDVLGMRDGGNSPDAVVSLQESADAGTQGQSSDNNPGLGQSHPGANGRASGTASAQSAHAPAAQNMTEHFEKLSAKLATEMAGRIHEQFSQGEWKMKFALKPASLGQVDVQLEMRDGKLAAVLQADNPMTQDLLQNGSQRLRDALSQMGLSQSSVSVGDGRSQAFQGDRQSGGQGSGTASSHPSDSLDDSVPAVANAPRRNSLSQLDFYA